jgi:hypothetical protein
MTRPDPKEQGIRALRPWGVVAELAGLLVGVEVDEKNGYAEYLGKKYSKQRDTLNGAPPL